MEKLESLITACVQTSIKPSKAVDDLFYGTYTTLVDVSRTIQIVKGGTVQSTSDLMVKNIIKQLTRQSNEIVFHYDGKDEVRFFNDVEYDDVHEELSEFVTYKVVMTKNNEVTTIKERKVRNPKFSNNPKCGFCYKKVTKIEDDNLLNKEKTPVKVCAKCKKELKQMRSIVAEIEEKKK